MTVGEEGFYSPDSGGGRTETANPNSDYFGRWAEQMGQDFVLDHV